MTSFADLSSRQQVRLLRPIAADICAEFGVTQRSIRLLHHAFNTTFRIDSADGRRFALRINIHSESNLEQLAAEIEWNRVLHAQGSVSVAEPQSGPDGQFVVSKEGPLGRPMHAVLYGWLGGRVGYKVATPRTLFQLGQTTAELHRQASGWNVPANCRFKLLPDLLYGHPVRLPSTPPFLRTLDLSRTMFARLNKEERIPIHYDLHLGNVKVCRGRLSIFDFDDAVLGWPILDASVTIHAIQRFPDSDQLQDAYWRGLGKRPADFGFTDAEFEALVVCRSLLIANAMLGPIDPRTAANNAKHIAALEERLATFWASG